MKKTVNTIILVIAVVLMSTSCWAGAGSSQAEGELFFEADRIIRFSKKVEKILAKQGARVAILGRVGRPRENLPKGVQFTHVAFAVYSQITCDDGRTIPGYAVYNLYQKSDDPDRSELIRDFPVDFFAGVQVLEAGILIPTPKTQKRLLEVLASDTYTKLHNPSYSVIANPYTPQLQNCTEHTLDVVFAAIYKTDDSDEIKRNEKAWFKAQKVNFSPLKLFFGSVFASDVAVSDHPGTPETATFTTIANFMEQYHLLSGRITVEEDTSL